MAVIKPVAFFSMIMTLIQKINETQAADGLQVAEESTSGDPTDTLKYAIATLALYKL